MIVAWLRRRRFAIAALTLYTALAVAVMAPLASADIPYSGAQDLCNHISGIIEARNALDEGQFPIRVGPNQIGKARYPIFQFYGNFPYTAGGLVYLVTDANPYTIWKFEVTAFLVVGAFGTYCCARRLTRQPIPAMAAGAVFMTAPYVLTDIHGRVAFCEIVSFMLLPAVFYFTWRSFVSRRVGSILASGIAWSALALSHNVTYLYAATYFGLFYLSWIRLSRRAIGRCVFVGAGFTLGLLLTAWSIVPQLQLLPYLCGGLLGNVWGTSSLTTLGVLLAPAVALPLHVPSTAIDSPAHFGLQVGWPILIAFGIAAGCLNLPGIWLHGRRALVARFLLLFVLAFLMTWTPVDFWTYLPGFFSFVQFSYRLLMFVVLWGALLAGYALALGWPSQMRPIHLVGVVLVLGWTAGPYMAPHRADPNLSVEKEIANPDIGRGGATTVYNMAGRHLAETSLVHQDVDWAAGGLLEYREYHSFGLVRAVFPTIQTGDALNLQGTVVVEATPTLSLKIALDDALIATPQLPPGPFQLTIPLPQTPGKQRVQVVVEGTPLVVTLPDGRRKKNASFKLDSLTLRPESVRSKPMPLLTAGELALRTSFHHPTKLRTNTPEPTLLQMPVLYYPGMLDVRVDGQNVVPANLGRFLAVEVPAGEHAVSVRFVGVSWSNAVSLSGWIGVLLVGIALLSQRVRRQLRTKTIEQRLFGVLLTRDWLGRLRRIGSREPSELHT